MMYGGKRVKVTAITTFQVHRNGCKHNLHFKVMSSKHCQPLLRRQACISIGALKWIDVDSMCLLEDFLQPSSVNKVDAKQAGRSLALTKPTYSTSMRMFSRGLENYQASTTSRLTESLILLYMPLNSTSGTKRQAET